MSGTKVHLAVVAGFLLLGLAAAQAPKPSFTVDLPVLVTDKKGQPVQGLDQDLFQVTDNGKPQRVLSMQSEARPVMLALVVDTYDADAIGQAHRSASALMAMVGDLGKVAIYTPGPTPVRLLALSDDRDKGARILRDLSRSPVAPLGAAGITGPADQAVRDLSALPETYTRAVVLISKSSARTGLAAQSLVESSMTEAITVIRISPNTPEDAADDSNPVSPDAGGLGQGSQRSQPPPAPVDGRGNPGMGSQPSLDLSGAINKAKSISKAVVEPHDLDYVFDSGGITLNAGNDVEFDQRLSQIANDLRSIYHLYYTPDNLTLNRERHKISLTVQTPVTGQALRWYYRRSYLGATPQ